MELGLDVHQQNSHAVVDVKGEVDVYTASKLREKLIELVSDGSYDIVVNLEEVEFLDSTGLGVLVGVLVGVLEGVFVGVRVGVLVGLLVGVLEGVFVGELVGVFVGVWVTVGVSVGVSVTVGVSVGV